MDIQNPKSIFIFSLILSISLSLITFAIIEAADTTGYFLSALFSATISTFIFRLFFIYSIIFLY